MQSNTNLQQQPNERPGMKAYRDGTATFWIPDHKGNDKQCSKQEYDEFEHHYRQQEEERWMQEEAEQQLLSHEQNF